MPSVPIEPPVPDEAGVLAELAEAKAQSTSPAPRTVVVVGGLLIGAAVAATALMLWQHHRVSALRDHDRAIVDAARTGVTALFSIDHTRAKDDVARVLAVTTGDFRADFARSADDFVATAEKSRAVTKGSVKASALESAEPDSGVVLLAVTSEVTNANGAKEDPRPFRMSVTVSRDGDAFKMSNLEFVP